MKKIILTLMTALMISANANASAVNIGSMVADKMSAANDTLKFEMRLNDKMPAIRRSFNLDPRQAEYLYDVQKNVEDGFAHINVIKDDSTRLSYMNNVLDYWHKNAYIAFSMTEQNTDFRKDYRNYWAVVNVTLNNNNIRK